VSYSSADLINRLIAELEDSESIPFLKILRDMAHKMDLIPDAFTEFTSEICQALQDLQTGTSLTISALKRALGTARGEGSTVWGAIDMLQGLVRTLTIDVFRTDIVSSVLTSIPLKRYMLASKQAFSDVVTRLVGLETTNTNIGSTLFGANHAVLPNHQVVQNLSADPVIISLSDRVEKLEVEAGFVKSDGDDVKVSFMGVRFS